MGVVGLRRGVGGCREGAVGGAGEALGYMGRGGGGSVFRGRERGCEVFNIGQIGGGGARGEVAAADEEDLGFEEELIHGGGALFGAFSEAAHDEVFDGLGEGGEVLGEGERGDRLVNVFKNHLNRGAALEGGVAAEALIHDDAEGIEVAAGVGLAALSLLRGHIGRGADEHACLRHVMADVEEAVVGEGFDEAEVEDFD